MGMLLSYEEKPIGCEEKTEKYMHRLRIGLCFGGLPVCANIQLCDWYQQTL